MAYLIQQQPLRTDGMAVFPWTPELEAKCKFITKFGDEVNMSVRVGNTIRIPRQLAPVGIEDWRVQKTPFAINCKVGAKTLEQAQLIAESYELQKKGINHTLEAPTGFGKTYCGCAIMARLGQPTLIVVPKEDLIHEWRKTLINLIGIDPQDIGTIQQDVCDYKGKKFVIGMVHSLVIPDRYPPEVYSYFGAMIVDEAHRMGADTFVVICHKVPALYRLALSATCNRSDGKWRLIEAHIGRVMVVGVTVPMSPKVLIKKSGWKIPKVKRFKNGVYVTEPIPHSAGRLMGVYKAMANDIQRNHLLLEFIFQAYAAGRVIVVMSDLIEHLTVMYALCLKKVPAAEMGYYIGKSSETDKKAAKETKRVIFATYKMCAEGTDAPRWDTLVYLSPRADVKQACGRVMRTMEGKKTPVIFDLVDDSGLLEGYASSRQKQYFEISAEQVKV
jgi:superfamily II DNA or RNA helicase